MGINNSRATQTQEEVVLRTTRSASLACKRFHDLMLLPQLAEILRYTLVTAYAKAIDLLGKKPNRVFMQEIRRNNIKMKQSLADMHAFAASNKP